MIILASDTSTSQGSVAMRGQDGKVLREDLDPLHPHSQTLLPAVEKLLARAGLVRGDVQAIAVGTGPGAFTGLRVGLATFKAWAGASGIPLIPVASMDAVALPLLQKSESAVVLLDARKGEVYAAYYPVLDKSNLPHRDGEVMLISVDSVPDWVSSLNDPRAHLAGTGLHLLEVKGFLEGLENLGDGSEAPDAAWVLALAETLLPLGHTVEPSGLVPCYVRPPDAKRPSPGTIVTQTVETGDRTDGF